MKKLNVLKPMESVIFTVAGLIACLAMVQPAEAQLAAVPKSEKHRIVLLTDIGGDRDDEQSFTQFMMYADQYDIEGLIATSIRIFPDEKHRPLDGEPQPQYLTNFIKAYGEVRGNLLKHSEGWPEPEALLKVIRKGVKTGRDAAFDIHIKGRLGGTISRWAPHFQNDFEARMDWCVKPFNQANHPPQPVLNGDKSLRPIEITAKPGQRITLDATGSSDIDKNKLSYTWRFYSEAGTYLGWIDIENANSKSASFVVPNDASGAMLHILLVLADDGAPPLTRYRRLVIRCQ